MHLIKLLPTVKERERGGGGGGGWGGGETEFYYAEIKARMPVLETVTAIQTLT